jgi:hypothetical protein
MKKLNGRKLTLTKETLRRLDSSVLAKVPGALAARMPIKNDTVIGPDEPNTVQGTSCGLCSDYVYCGPSAFPCDDTIAQ